MKDLIEPAIGPGVYDDLPIDTYHGDCCEGPSLSSTGIRAVLSDPGDFWHDSVLNPANKPAPPASDEEPATVPEIQRKRHFDIGKCAHLMLLEPELVAGSVSVVPKDKLASNGALTTNAAKAFVAEQAALGRIVLKPGEWDFICDMADALRAHPQVRALLRDGTVEQSHLFLDPKTGVMLKSRPDFTPNASGRWIVDYKTTDLTDIDKWARAATVDHRLDIQAALQLWGAHEAKEIDCLGVCYVVQCNKPPHRIALRYIALESFDGRQMLDVARIDMRKSLTTFAECWATRKFPSKWNTPAELIAPDFRLRQIEKQLTEEYPEFANAYAA